jgi:hypothetical protein
MRASVPFPRRGLQPLLSLLPLLPLVGGCGPTEVLVGDAPGVARIVVGVLGVSHEVTFPDTADTGDAITLPIGSPAGLIAFEDGGFYFADRFRRRVGFVSTEGVLTWPVGAGSCPFPGLGTGDPTTLCLDDAGGIALGPDGSVAIADLGAHRVYRYLPVENRVEVVLGTGSPGRAADGAVARTSPTDMPVEVAIGPDGAVYVAELRNFRVVRVGADGLVTSVVGTGEVGDDGDDGPARAARVGRPAGLAWMGDTLYVADALNNRIRRVIRDTISAYAGLGAAGFAGDRGPARLALFREPGRMAAVGSLLFVADRGNQRVRIIRVGADSITTFAGTGAAVPGPDRLDIGRTSLAGPVGVAAAGRVVFVSDSGGCVVRRVVR